MVKLSVAIQHHPKRPYLVEPLLAALAPGPEPDVVADPEPDGHPSPWRTYRHALETAPAGATHRLVIQDDAHPCRDFQEAARRAVSARPEALVVFCVLGAPRSWAARVMVAAGAGRSWAELDVHRLRTWVPVVAISWPVSLVEPVLGWIDRQRWPATFVADDEVVGRAANGLRLPTFATVPSLVEHPDDVESAVGRRTPRHGLDHQRVAACFIDDEECDPLSIDWA